MRTSSSDLNVVCLQNKFFPLLEIKMTAAGDNNATRLVTLIQLEIKNGMVLPTAAPNAKNMQAPW